MQVARKLAEPLSLPSIDDALLDPNLLGAALGDLESWSTWRTILKAAFGLPLDAAELTVFTAIAGGRKPPKQRVAELWVIAGRRGGKSRMAGAVCAYLAAFNSHKLSVGETGAVLALAVNKSQAKAVFDYAHGFLGASPILSGLLVGEPTSEEIRLSGNVTIAVHPANFRSVRSRTLIGCVYDESAFWRDNETAANPDAEIYTATLPSLSTTNGMLVGISSPYRASGILFRKHQAAFGKDDPHVLVVQAPSLRLNPTISTSAIERARELDPEKASSEWDAQFRSDLADFLTRVAVMACVDEGVHERAPDRSLHYVAFCDPSGGSQDLMTLAVAHREGETSVLDALREIRPPFNPEAVTAEFAALLKSYRINSVKGDKYAGEWVVSQFRSNGIFYEHSDKTKSEIYLDALPRINSHEFALLDNQRLIGQLLGLERRVGRTGRDTVDHAPGSHDDLANAALGALLLASSGATGIAYSREDRERMAREQGFRPDKIADPLEAW